MTNAMTPRRLRLAAIGGLAAASTGGAVLVADHATDARAASGKTATARAASTQAPSPPNPAQEDARLAKALGISEDKLKAARAEVRGDQIDAAVKAGKLTGKQQDLIEQLEATGFDVPLPPGAAPAPGSGTDPDTALAKALGVSVDKLRDARPTPPAGGPPAPPSGGPASAPKPPSAASSRSSHRRSKP